MNPLSPNSTIALLSIINVFTSSTPVFLLAVFAGPKTYWVLALSVFLRYALEIQEAYHFGNVYGWSLPYQQRLLCLLAEAAYFSLTVDFIRRKTINIWECVGSTLERVWLMMACSSVHVTKTADVCAVCVSSMV